MNYFRIASKLFFRKNSLPVYLILFVTNQCNARCSHCFYLKKINQPSQELKLDELIKISKNLKSVEHLSITGGEPFIREDLFAIIQTFYECSKIRSINLSTNGLLSDKIFTIVRRVLEACPELNLQVTISIDGIGAQHDEIRGVAGVFSKATETIEKLKIIINKNLQIAVNTTLTEKNYKNIQKTYFYIRDVIQPDSFFPLLIRGDVKKAESEKNIHDAYKKLVFLWEQDMKTGHGLGYKKRLFSSYLNARDMLSRKLVLDIIGGKNKQHINCLAGNLTGVMYENGDVSACEVKDLKMGNIREADYQLEKVWFSQEAVQIKKWIKQNKCFCTHEGFLNLNIVFNPQVVFRLLKEWLKLIY